MDRGRRESTKKNVTGGDFDMKK